MFTLLGSLLGFVTSTIPSVLKFFQDRADRSHELAIMDRQMEMQKAGHAQRLEEINVQADIAESQALYNTLQPTGVKWVDGLSGSVRPVITYAFFALFAAVKVSALYVLIAVEGVLLSQALRRSGTGRPGRFFPPWSRSGSATAVSPSSGGNER